MFDAIIVGKGPSGISCGIYLKRYNLNPLIIGKNDGNLNKAKLVENYYGISKISGEDLFNQGVEQAKNLGISVLDEEVLSITYDKNFIVKTNKSTYEGKTVVIACGKNKQKLMANNLNFYENKGISYCATCDGFFFRDKKIGIVGSKDYMFSELEVLESFTKDIVIFTNEEELTKDTSYTIDTGRIISFVGNEEYLTKVVTSNQEHELDAVFIAIGSAGALDFCYHMGIAFDEDKYIKVDENYMTNLSGVFAVGDVIGGFLQINKAVTDGAICASKIKNYLQKKNL